jgi:hypothetical protein
MKVEETFAFIMRNLQNQLADMSVEARESEATELARAASLSGLIESWKKAADGTRSWEVLTKPKDEHDLTSASKGV